MSSPTGVEPTVPLKSKLPPIISFLVRHISFLERRVSFLARITETASMEYTYMYDTQEIKVAVTALLSVAEIKPNLSTSSCAIYKFNVLPVLKYTPGPGLALIGFRTTGMNK